MIEAQSGDQEGQEQDDGYIENYNEYNAPPGYDVIAKVLEFESIRVEIENQLQGRVYNPETQKFEQVYSPYMNSKGAGVLMTLLNSHLTTNFALTSLNEEIINKMAKRVNFAVAEILESRMDEFEIHEAHLNAVCIIIQNNVDAILNRALFGRTLRALTSVTKRTEAVHKVEHEGQHARQEPNKNIFERFMKG
jgi:hypothetical protein